MLFEPCSQSACLDGIDFKDRNLIDREKVLYYQVLDQAHTIILRIYS